MTIVGYLTVVIFFITSIAMAKAKTYNGLIGYGIAEYQPLCCWTCMDVLSSPYLSCTEFSNMEMKLRPREMMMMMGTTSDTCRLSNNPYMETLAYCIRDQCSRRGVSFKVQSQCFRDVIPAGRYNLSLQQTLPQEPPTMMLSSDAMWLNQTSLVNTVYYHDDYLTMQAYSRSGYSHSRYSLIVWIVVVGICLLIGLYRLLRNRLNNFAFSSISLAQNLNKHFILPPLFGSRHLEPLPYKIGYLPSRSLSFMIAMYVLLNIVFSCVDIHRVWPATWWSSPRSETAGTVADRTGNLGIANFALAILFSGRNSLLITITGWSQTTMLTFHRWTARVAVLQAIVHSIVYSLQWYWDGGASLYGEEMAVPGYSWGAVGTIALAIILPLAILPLRSRYYELFLVVHIVLVIIALIGTWYHIQLVYWGEYGFQIWLYIAFAFWGFDRFIRLIRLAVLNRRGASTIQTEILAGGKFCQLTVFPKVAWHVTPGQHVFLYMLQRRTFWENHPFSVVSHGYMALDNCNLTTEQDKVMLKDYKGIVTVDEKRLSGIATDLERAIVLDTTSSKSSASFESGSSPETPRSKTESLASDGLFYLRFVIRLHSGMTSSLTNSRPASPSTQRNPSTVKTTAKVLLEGPYGSLRQGHRPLETADVVLCIAGGIGVTHCLGFLNRYIADTSLPAKQRSHLMRHTQRFVFAWSVREPELFQHFRKELVPSLGGLAADEERKLEHKFWLTGFNHVSTQLEQDGTVLETGHRMDVQRVVDDVLEQGKRVALVVCGPGGLADAVRREALKGIGRCISVDILEEAFTW